MNILQIVFLAWMAQAAPSAPAPSGVIEGLVVKLGTTDPIAGADVELSRVDVVVITADPNARPGFPGSPPPPTVFKATSQDDGKFTFKELPAGRYRLVATRSGGGYAPAEFGQRDPKGHGTTLLLSNGQKLNDVRLAMPPTSSISGRVSDGDDEPIANARVMAVESIYRNGRRSLSVVQSVRSDDQGNYRLFWLRPGRYYVAVMREDLRGFSFAVHVVPPDRFGMREDATGPIARERTLQDGQVIEETDRLIYFGGSPNERDAQAVDLLPGATVSAVDVSLQNSKVQSRRVKGIVLGPNGQPAAAAIVRLIPRQPAPHSIIPNAETDKQGAFSISGVIPGIYYLFSVAAGATRGFSFNETFLDPSNGSSARILLDVSDRDIDGISLLLKSPFSVPGKIVVEGTDVPNSSWDLTKPRVMLSRDPSLLGMPTAGSISAVRPGQQGSGVPSADGSFVLSGFGPGEYRVNIYAIPGTAYVKSVRLGGVDVLRDGLQVDNNPDGQLDILINLDGGHLEGVATNDKSEPISNATVVLVPDVPNRANSYLYKVATADSSGKYQMRGIAPGNYKAFAWESIETGRWQDPEFLNTVEVRGTPVRVTDGSTQQLPITVLPR